ncbi:hypothetical protein TSOC_012150, partial [Tetrabaena socialis]
WALRQVREGFSTAPAPPASREQPPPPPGPAPDASLAAAASAPWLVAVLGLPLLLGAAEKVLRGRGAAAAAAARAGAHARTAPVAALLAGVAGMGGEGEAEVWGLLMRVLAEALGGGAGGGGGGGGRAAASEGAAAALGQQQQHHQQQRQEGGGGAAVAAGEAATPAGDGALLRFSATLLAFYLQGCGAHGCWVLYDTPPEGRQAAGGGGGAGGQRRAAAAGVRGVFPQPRWPGPMPVRPPACVAGTGAVAGAQQQPQQQRPAFVTAGCVPVVALRTLVWLQRYTAAYGGTHGAAGDVGAEEGEAGVWRDVERMCAAFVGSPLGGVMLGWLGGGGEARDVEEEAEKQGLMALVGRALGQGLSMPPKLQQEVTALVAQGMAPRPGQRQQQPEPQRPEPQQRRQQGQARQQLEGQRWGALGGGEQEGDGAHGAPPKRVRV